MNVKQFGPIIIPGHRCVARQIIQTEHDILLEQFQLWYQGPWYDGSAGQVIDVSSLVVDMSGCYWWLTTSVTMLDSTDFDTSVVQPQHIDQLANSQYCKDSGSLVATRNTVIDSYTRPQGLIMTASTTGDTSVYNPENGIWIWVTNLDASDATMCGEMIWRDMYGLTVA